MKKTVLKLDLHDDKDKRKALKTVSTLSGIDSISIDMKERKLTVVGIVDPIDIVKKLRKSSWNAEIFSVGAPQKEGGGDKGGAAGEKGGAAAGEKKNNPNVEQMAELLKAYQTYYHHNPTYIPAQHYYTRSIDESPSNTCVII